MNLFFEPRAWLGVIFFSALAVFANLAAYELGKEGVEAVVARFSKIKPEQLQRAADQYKKWGAWVLPLSGVPGLGLLVTTAAGVFGVKKRTFIFWVFWGKFGRYWLLLWLAVTTFEWITT